jgi:hypothetical protein
VEKSGRARRFGATVLRARSFDETVAAVVRFAHSADQEVVQRLKERRAGAAEL